MGMPVKLCMIFQQSHTHTPSLAHTHITCALPLKLGNKNYDYDVFIVLMRPVAIGNLPNTTHTTINSK